MSYELGQVTTFWTVAAFLTAAGGGIAMALVIWHLRPGTSRFATFFAVTLGVLYYVPQIMQRALDPDSPEGGEWRTVGTAVLFLVGFVIPMWLALQVLQRRTRP